MCRWSPTFSAIRTRSPSRMPTFACRKLAEWIARRFLPHSRRSRDRVTPVGPCAVRVLRTGPTCSARLRHVGLCSATARTSCVKSRTRWRLRSYASNPGSHIRKPRVFGRTTWQAGSQSALAAPAAAISATRARMPLVTISISSAVSKVRRSRRYFSPTAAAPWCSASACNGPPRRRASRSATAAPRARPR